MGWAHTILSATFVGNCRLGSILTGSVSCRSSKTSCFLASHDGFVYSQVSAMPGNARGSTACLLCDQAHQVYGLQVVWLAFALLPEEVHKCYVMARSQSMSRNNLCPDRGTKSDCEDSRQGGLSQKRCVRGTLRGRQRSASTSFSHERKTWTEKTSLGSESQKSAAFITGSLQSNSCRN